MEYINLLPTEALIVIVSLVGLCIGSFINVVISRLPLMLKNTWDKECHDYLNLEYSNTESTLGLCLPSSHCMKCKSKINWFDNIPIISYILLRGRCRSCHIEFSPRYFYVELLSLFLSIIVLLHYKTIAPTTLLVLLFSWMLIAISFIDIENMIIPDNLNYSLLWTGLICNQFSSFTTLSSAVWGAIAGYLTLWSIYHIFKLVTGKEGMGFGDFKLFAAAGAWLGLEMLPLILLIASAIGSIIGISSILLKRSSRDIPIPFGPYLCLAMWISMLWGDSIYSKYLLLFVRT